MLLHCIWPTFPHGCFSDRIGHSDFDPRNAPFWMLRALKKEDIPLPRSARLRQLLSFRAEALKARRHSYYSDREELASRDFCTQGAADASSLPTTTEMLALVDDCLAQPVSAPPSCASNAGSS